MRVIVVNSGSSSIKYRLFDMPEARVLAQGVVERIGEEESLAVQKVLDAIYASARTRREVKV